MQCKNCGTVNDDGSKFCKECGTKLETPAPKQEVKPEDQLRIGELIYAAHRHKEAGNIEDALLACHGALALNPDSAPAHALLSSLYESKGDLRSAVFELERVVALNPGSEIDRDKLADLQSKLYSPTLSENPAFGDYLERFRPYMPHSAAAASLLVVLVFGLIITRGWSGGSHKKHQPVSQTSGYTSQASPSVTPPVQAYSEQYTQNQDSQAASSAMNAPVANASVSQAAAPSQPEPGLPARTQQPIRASLPQPKPISVAVAQPAQQVKPLPVVGSNEPPVIVPVPDSEESSGNSVIVTSAGTASTPVAQPAKPAAQPKPAKPVYMSPEERALQLQGQGRYQDAIASYRDALGRTQDAGRIHQQMALCYQRMGDSGSAINHYNKAIDSFRQQIAAGRDSASANLNIKACERGIQVCR